MQWIHFDKDLELRMKRGEYKGHSPQVDHVKWVAALVARNGVDQAYRICRRYAVPRFVYKKATAENIQAGFYQSALGYLKKHYPYQSKHGRG